MYSFNWIQSNYKILMKNTKKTRTKNSARENIDLFTKKNQKLTVGKEIILSNNDLKKKKQLIIKKSTIIG